MPVLVVDLEPVLVEIVEKVLQLWPRIVEKVSVHCARAIDRASMLSDSPLKSEYTFPQQEAGHCPSESKEGRTVTSMTHES